MKTARAIIKTRISVSVLLCGIIVFWGFQVTGEEFTAEQQEIWKLVIADWELLKQGDMKGLMAMRHDNALIWWPDNVVPFGGTNMWSKYKSWLEYDKPIAYVLKPIKIQIYDNVAITAYEQDWKGNIMSVHARVMETWIKQNNKWLKVSSLSASCDKLPLCMK